MKISILVPINGKWKLSHDLKKTLKVTKRRVNRSIYSSLKSLELSSKFDNAVSDSRKRLRIPSQGLNWKKYFKKAVNFRQNRATADLIGQPPYYFSSESKLSGREAILDKEIAQITNAFTIHPVILTTLDTIIVANYCLFLSQYTPLYIQYDKGDLFSPPQISIVIQTPVTNSAIKAYIDRNSQAIIGMMSKLPSPPIYLSDFELECLTLKNRGLTDSQIAEHLAEKHDSTSTYADIKAARTHAKSKAKDLL